MQLELITLGGVTREETIYEVVIPTEDGEIAVFPGHEPLVSLVKAGALSIRKRKQDKDSEREYYAISGGVIEVSPARVKILVDEAESSEDIIESEAQAALERAQAKRDSLTDKVDIERAKRIVERSAARLKVAELRRHHH